jgi:RadC-like JAB domain-containing protein
MAPRPADPSKYNLHVVSFSVLREGTGENVGRRPLLSEPAAVAALARQIIADDAKEHFWALLLDSQNRLVAAHEVSTGTLSASLVHPREVFAPALRIMGIISGATPMTRINSEPSLELRIPEHDAPGAWLQDMRARGFSVPLQLCRDLSHGMRALGLPFVDTFRLLWRRGYIQQAGHEHE